MIPVSLLRRPRESGGPGTVGKELAALGTRFRGYDEKRGPVPSVKFVPLGLMVQVLLGQNVPIGVRRILGARDVRAFYHMGWAGLSNGDLLDRATGAGIKRKSRRLLGRNVLV